MAKYQTDEPCVACGAITENGNCLHHLTTRGAGGGDEPENLMPLCFNCHEEIHRSIGKMVENHYFVGDWLISHGRFDILEKARRVK